MAYNNNIPLANQPLNTSQADILANFAAIKTLIDINHVTFDVPDQGKHKFVSFPLQSAAPVFGANETGLYNKVYATTVKDELYVHKEVFGGTVDIPFTASTLSNTSPVNTMDGWTYLPSGLLLKWESISGNGLTTITTSTGPAFTNIFSVLLTVTNPSTSDSNTAVTLVDILSNTQYRVFFSTRAATGAAAGNAKALIIGV